MMPKTLTRDAVVVRGSAVLSTLAPDETLAMDIASGTCFAFNGPSARIWALLETPKRVDQLVRTLVAEYEIEEAACHEETLGFLKKLMADGVVVFAESADKASQ